MGDFQKAVQRVERVVEGSKGAFTDDLRTILAGIEQAKEEISEIDRLSDACANENERLRDLLGQGLYLCARAKHMSEQEKDSARLLTWFGTQYQTDLDRWAEAASDALKGGA